MAMGTMKFNMVHPTRGLPGEMANEALWQTNYDALRDAISLAKASIGTADRNSTQIIHMYTPHIIDCMATSAVIPAAI